MEFFIVLASLGLLFIIKDSYILSVPREILKAKNKTLKEFLECPQCIGFWCGFILSLLYKISIECLTFSEFLISLYTGFIVSMIGIIVNDFLDIIDSKAYELKNKSK